MATNESQLIQALLTLQTASTKADKQQVLQANATTPNFKTAIEFLLNPFDAVGLSTKKLNKPVALDYQADSFPALLTYLHAHRTGTNEDIAVVLGYLSQFNQDEQAILKSLIAKTLTLGVSAKS
ncbi:hypothetical protein [Secundilactobacillus mixtipabuli]|uniref:Uncharacterized protein n=1 Tax=Secundilactobacillus mixtipabuli TaxID=1435342 RepID=A0A1Z5IDQ2_9LACO|nr:hypothetical protein [Secundilactobacillus mixtipabuli]GAW99580.1 hypothetical protein IWT30_01550 [Secundilactobacillus mixtipabuli]